MGMQAQAVLEGDLRVRWPAQRGQAMVDLLLAAVVIVPLLLGILLLGGVLDLQAAVHQASSLAAFQQAMAPAPQRGNTPTASDLARLAVFEAQARRGAADDDRTRAAATVWRTPDGTALLSGREAVQVHFSAEASPTSVDLAGAARSAYRLTSPTLDSVRVTATTALGDSFAPLAGVELSLSSTVAIAGTAWAGAGAADVASRVQRATPVGAIGLASNRSFQAVADLMVGLLEDTPAPRFGCVSADVVPNDRLSRRTAPRPCGDRP